MGSREFLKNKKRIVVKLGSSSLTDKETGDIDLKKLRRLAGILVDFRSKGKEIVLVSSGAQFLGRRILNLSSSLNTLSERQVFSSVGQINLISIYKELFSEYNQVVSQILLTKNAILKKEDRHNIKNLFNEFFHQGIIPIVNENDAILCSDFQFGDNDCLSAFILSIINGDLLVLLSDVDGFYADDPIINPNAFLIDHVENILDVHFEMAKKTSSSTLGTGGMKSKIFAGVIATCSGADMVLANGSNVMVLYEILDGKVVGTFFKGHFDKKFDIDFLLAKRKFGYD